MRKWIAVIGLLAAGVARADNPQIAEGLFADGVRLMDQKRYAEACAKFQSSLEYLDGLGTRGKLADCWEKLGRVATAWTAWRDVAARARRSGEAAREKVANERAGALAKRIPYLTVTAPRIDGLAVAKDGVALDPAAFGTPIPVDPGAHEVTATAPGREDFSTVTLVREGERRDVEIPELAPVAVAEPVTPPLILGPEPPHVDPRRTRRVIGMSAVAVGGAAMVAGGVVAILAKSQWDGAFDGTPPHCDASHVCDAVGFADTDSARTKATVAGILVGGGAAVAIAGAILWWSGTGDSSDAHAHLAPLRLPSGLGVSLAGGF